MELKPEDLIVSTFNTSRGGWSANNNGVRIIHTHTGVTVEYSSHSSQHRNKAECMKILEVELEKYMEDTKEYAAEIYNEYGSPYVFIRDGKCFWAIEGACMYKEEEIPLSLYGEFKRFVTGVNNK